MTTPMMKTFHHLTRLFVLSAVFRWVRSRTTMYDCSSLTWARISESLRTETVLVQNEGMTNIKRLSVRVPSASRGSCGVSDSET